VRRRLVHKGRHPPREQFGILRRRAPSAAAGTRVVRRLGKAVNALRHRIKKLDTELRCALNEVPGAVIRPDDAFVRHIR
jgi:hypothetical protein